MDTTNQKLLDYATMLLVAIAVFVAAEKISNAIRNDSELLRITTSQGAEVVVGTDYVIVNDAEPVRIPNGWVSLGESEALNGWESRDPDILWVVNPVSNRVWRTTPVRVEEY